MQVQQPEQEIGEVVTVKGRIRRELYDEFVHYFPQFGATQWAVELAFKSLVEIARSNPVPMQLKSMLQSLVQEVETDPDSTQ